MKNKYLKVILISLIMSSIMIIPNIIKGNGILSIGTDFNYQQIPFSMSANELIKEGNVLYDWNNDLGTNFIGTFSFYNLASPFFLISILFKASWYPYLIGPFLILKYVVASLLAYLYLKRYVKNKDYAIIGALLYSFSGFQLSNMLFFHFHDVVAFFPVLLIALDKVMLDNKKGWFVLAVTINALINYFSFVGQVVFLIIYFIIKLLTKEYKLTVKKFIQLAFESLIGVGIAAIILVPSFIFVLGNPRVGGSWNLINAIKPSTYNIMEILRGMLLGPDIMSSRGLFCEYLFTSAELYLPFIGIILFAAYMWKKPKKWISILLITCFVFMIIPILNSSFFAFTTSYYARWFYMPILIMSLATSKALEENIKLRHGYITTGILFILFIILILIYKSNGNKIIYHGNYVIANSLIVLFGYIGLYLVYKFKNNKKLFVNLLLIGIILSNLCSGFVFFYKYNKLSSPKEYTEKYINNNLKLDYLKDGERTDSNNSVPDNLGYVLNIPHLKNFNTSISKGSFKFYESIGITRVVKTEIGENEPKVRDFLSTKYIITTKEDRMDLKLVETNDYYNVYQNNNYLSMGIPYQYYISKEDYNKLDYNTRKDLLIYAVVLDESQIKKYSTILEKINLNDLEKLNKEYEKYIKSLQSKTSKNFKYTKQGATFDLTAKEDSFIVLSIPYDKGWTIKINNKEISYEEVDSGLIGLTIKSGTNKINLEYKTPGLNIGICISIVSLLSFIGYLSLEKLKNKRLDHKI